MSKDKSYLGDGVYVDIERGMLRLTTRNGINTQNAIYLDNEALISFVEYLAAKAINLDLIKIIESVIRGKNNAKDPL